MARPHTPSKLKPIGRGHAASVSRHLSDVLGGGKVGAHAGGWTVQAHHDGVAVLISKHANAGEILLALQMGGYIYTVTQHQRGSTAKITHRKV